MDAPRAPEARSPSDCRKELARCFPGLVIEAITRVPQPGADSDVFVVNDDWIFRLPRNTEVVELIRKEIALLPELAPTLPVAVPRFEFACQEHSVVGYRMIRGHALSDGLVAAVGERLIGTDLGHFVTALHSFPPPRARLLGVPDGPAEPARCVDECERFRSVVGPMLSSEERQAAVAVINDVLDDPEAFAFEPVLVHTELNPEHLLFSDTGTLLGVIDWSDCAVADPALDLARLVNSLQDAYEVDIGAEPNEVSPTLAAAYERPRDPAFDRRARLYFQVLGPFWEIEHGVRSGGSAFVASARAKLRARLEST